MRMDYSFMDGTFSFQLSLFITSITSNIWKISFGLIRFLYFFLLWWNFSFFSFFLKFFLVYTGRDWFPVSSIFSSLITSLSSSCAHYSQSLLKDINFLLAQIPWMIESDDLGRPFKVVLTISPPLKFSSTASSCSLIWETLVK